MPQGKEITNAQKRILEKREIQRNIARKKGSRKKGGSLILLYIMLAFLFIGIFITLSLTVFFKIDAIEVAGESKYTNEEIIMITGIEKGQNLISINKEKVINRIISGLPYIEDVKIKKSLPSKLVIEVSPAIEKYGFIMGDKYLYTSSKLKVLTENAEQIQSSVLVAGFDLKEIKTGENIVFNNSSQEELFNKVAGMITSGTINNITHIYLNQSGELNLVYDGRIIFICGSEAGLEKKLSFAYKVCTDPKEKISEPDFKGTLDLSDYNNENPSIRSRAKDITDIISEMFGTNQE